MREEPAILQELFSGLTLTDLLAPYQDTVDRLSVSVVTNGGRRLPLDLSGQHTPRAFLLSGSIDAQAQMLEWLGLMVDVEARSREAMEMAALETGFSSSAVKHSLR